MLRAGGPAMIRAGDDVNRLPRVAITLGDVAGIGPEVVARACCDQALRAICEPVVVGNPAIFERALRSIGSTLGVERLMSAAAPATSRQVIGCWDPASSTLELSSVLPGVIDPRSGR